MMQKVVRKYDLNEYSEVRENLKYWLSRTPEERITAAEFLRRQVHGSTARLQRVVRVIQRT